jgi:hypothetical protein
MIGFFLRVLAVDNGLFATIVPHFAKFVPNDSFPALFGRQVVALDLHIPKEMIQF